MRVISRFLLILVFLLAFSPVYAVALGDVQLRSYLMEPLLAEIALVEAKEDDLQDLKIRIASQADFDRFGVVRYAIHDSVTFTVVQKGGNRVIEVRSSRPIREPYFSFPVELIWRDGQYVREYTVFLDPRPVTRSAVAESRESQPAPKAQSEAAPAAQPKATPVEQPSPAKEFWLVNRGDTLWGIAENVKPSSATTPQMMMALLRANPEAFSDSNVNNLKAGSNLRIPDSGEIQVLSARLARQAFNAQTRQWRQSTKSATPEPVAEATPQTPAVTDSVAMVEVPGVEEVETETVEEPAADEPIVEEPVSADEPADDSQLRIVADPKTTVESPVAKEIAELERQLLLALEQSEADRLELETLDGRVEQIQAEMMRMRRLIILKNEQIAALQAARDDAPLPPRVDIDKVAPRPDSIEPDSEAASDERPTVATIEKPEGIATEPPTEVDWGIWLAVGAGILGLLMLLTLYLRRDRAEYALADHIGVASSSDRDQPYPDKASNFRPAKKDAVAVAPTGTLSGNDGPDRRGATPKQDSPNTREDWQRDDFGSDGDSLLQDSLDSRDLSSHMTDEELESLVQDLNVDFDSIDTGSSLMSETKGAPGVSKTEPKTTQFDETVASDEIRQGTTTDERLADIPPVEDETDVAALRLELAQAYLEIGEIEGARDILTQVVEEAMEGPEQEEARRLLESLG